LENPTRFSSLDKNRICCTADQLRMSDSILLQAIKEFNKLHSKKNVKPKPTSEILSYIKDNLLVLFVDDKYVIGLDVGYTWFSDEKYLLEEFVFKYGEGPATMQDISDAIACVGKAMGCVRARVGTLAADSPERHRALAHLYTKAGFKLDAITLTREIDYGTINR